ARRAYARERAAGRPRAVGAAPRRRVRGARGRLRPRGIPGADTARRARGLGAPGSRRRARDAACVLSARPAGCRRHPAAAARAGAIRPAELTRSGQRRRRLRMRVGGGTTGAAGTVAGASGLSFDEVVSFRWEATLAGEMLSARELVALARLKAPLVRFRGQWVAVDPKELEEARRLLAAGGATLAAHEAVAVALGESARRPEARLPVDVVAEGQLAGVVARLRGGLGTDGVTVPRNFRGTLRPYQERGLAWLARMADLCLGACLADDMGLGKTIQLLAFLLHRR